MNKYDVYLDIEKRLKDCSYWTKTREGSLILGIVMQRVADALGMHKANRAKPRNSQETHQQIAIQWFRAKEHWGFADMLEIEPTWINWLLRTKGGVEL